MSAPVTSHAEVDQCLLRLVEACVRKIDDDPALLAVARNNVRRWSNERLRAEWEQLLNLPWRELRALLLEDSDRGCLHRQNAPLGGILTHRERFDLLH
ncbi:MAG: hypothetical protein LBK99_24320 [Opitutaceae bacterium]|jgi:hypothetical protein|nr:hypothetical protein [Opitutaceae bacterium]